MRIVNSIFASFAPTLEELKAKLQELQQEIILARQETRELAIEKDSQLRVTPPIGSIIFMASEKPPSDDYLLCDGRELSRTEYAELFETIGTTWGMGDETSTFNIPDLRGVFPRFLDLGKGLDNSRSLGSLQQGATKMPNAVFQMAENGNHTHSLSTEGNHSHVIANAGNHSHTMSKTGNHNHRDGGFDNLLKYDGQGTSDGSDTAQASGHRQPNLEYSKPMKTVGEHIHAINANGNHAHSMSAIGQHSHTVESGGNHTHSITGGDLETRPINQALVGFIRI